MSRDTAALLRAFKACGVTRVEIARRAGVSQSLVSMASGGRPKEPLPRTNYDKDFGTPERAARQVVKCKEDIIDTVSHECGVEAGKKVGRVYKDVTEESYLNWLKGENE